MLSPRGATDLCGARCVPRTELQGTGWAVSGQAPDQGGGADAGGGLRAQVRKDGGGVGCRHSEPPGGGVKRSGAGLRAQSGAEPWLSHAASHLCRTLYAPSSVDLHSPTAWGLLERRSQYPSPKPRWLAPSPGTSPALLCCAIPARPSGWDLSHLGSCTFKIHPGMVLWI